MKRSDKFKLLERSNDYFQLKCDKDNNKLTNEEFILEVCNLLIDKDDDYFKAIKKEIKEKDKIIEVKPGRSAAIRIPKAREL